MGCVYQENFINSYKTKISESIKKHWILRKLRMEADKNESRFIGIAC